MIVRVLSGMVLSGVLSCLRPAQAQAQEPVFLPVIPVHVRAGYDQQVEIARREDGIVLAACRQGCVAMLPAGQYRVRLFRGDAVIGERRMRLREPATWTVTAHDRSTRDAGLVLGIVGSAFVLTGAILTLPVVMGAMCHDSEGCTDEGETTRARIGLPLLVGGAVMTPIGWVMFGRNLRPRIQVSPFDLQHAPRAFRFGVDLDFF